MDYVTVIGGANIDIHGFSEKPLVMGDSNPGRIANCSGGVGRNIAENLARLGVDVKLISVIGNDAFGAQIVREGEAAGIDLSHSLFLKTGTSVYLALMDNRGEMALALSDMRNLEKLDAAYLKKKKALIAGSKIIVLDANLGEEALQYLVSAFKDRPLFLDPVSSLKAKKIKPLLGNFDTLKLSRLEAAVLSGLDIDTQKKNLQKIGAWFIEQGVKRVLITLGKDGIFCHSQREHFFRPVHYVEALSASGAGDAFMAGIVYGTLNQYHDDEIAEFASTLSTLTVQSVRTVSEKISVRNIKSLIKKSRKNAEEKK
ncbi:carbohydrate kinase [Spirochaetia bacterium]|nr:carbohydrate kinase [Spirochaetia bacterium]